jgi:lipopolysaccharide/colanic/teichoic acid biosynthesis glycosyltransferase
MSRHLYAVIKRAFDFTVSFIALTILSPLLVVVAAIIKLESKGPAIYKSKRVGQYYKIFDLYKFRTMKQDADKDSALLKQLNQYENNSTELDFNDDECPFCQSLGKECSPLLLSDEGTICENYHFLKREKPNAFYKIVNDPRVTPFGQFLRKTSIDELPQLFNILKGDMSLIGNRPLPLYEAEKITSDYAVERFNSPAGLTGLWQVTQRGTEKVSEQGRINLDKEYARTWSLSTDVKIFLRTFPALIQKQNV